MRRLFTKLADALFGEPESVSDTSPDQQHSRQQQFQQHQHGRHRAAAAKPTRSSLEEVRAESASVVCDAPKGDGGCQSLGEIKAALRFDEDGDEAHDFIVIEAPRRASRSPVPQRSLQ